DIARMKELVAVAKAHDATILDDEAHSMGFFGEKGRGVVEAAGVEDQVDVVVGTFSRSVGTVGGFVVSNHPKFDILRVVCRPYVFTASLPPSVVATARKAIELIASQADRRKQLMENSRTLHAGLKAAGFQLGTKEAESAIIAVICPDQDTTVKLWATLLDAGVYVNMARPPATPHGLYLIRMSLCAEHTPEQVKTIVERFTAAAGAAGYPLHTEFVNVPLTAA